MRRAMVFLAIGLLLGIVAIGVLCATASPSIAQGSGQAEVKLSIAGWLTLITTALGSAGLTVTGILSIVIEAIASRLNLTLTKDQSTDMASDAVELGAALTAYSRDPDARANKRRFMFALADYLDYLPDCHVTNDAGVLVIRYSGLVDVPETPAT